MSSLLVRPATNDEEFRAQTFQHRHGGIDLRGHCCGVFVAGCQEWLDTFPELLDASARSRRAMRRYQFRAIHIIALDYASRTSGGWNIQLPELGAPTQEVKVGNIDGLHWSTLEKAWGQAWPDDALPMTFNPHLHGARAHVLSRETIEHSLIIAHEIASRPGHDGEMLTRLYEAYVFATHASYTHSFTTCWNVAEQCLSTMYDSMIGEVGRHSRNRRPINTVIKELNDAGRFEPDDYAFLDRARRIRNKLTHDIDAADLSTALELIWVTQRLLGASIGFQPTFGFNGRSPG